MSTSAVDPRAQGGADPRAAASSWAAVGAPAVAPDVLIDLRAAEAEARAAAEARVAAEVRSPAQGEPVPSADERVDAASPAHPSIAPREWWRLYQAGLVLLDAAALVIAGMVAIAVRFPGRWLEPEAGTGVPYALMTLVAVPVWVATIAARRGYEVRCFGTGSEEFRRLCHAGLIFTAITALVALATDAAPARKLVAIAVPLACLIAVVLRLLARKRLQRHRRAGAASHRVLVVGEGASQSLLVDRLTRSPGAGLQVVGTARPQIAQDGRSSLAHVVRLVVDLRADTVAVAHSPHVTPDALRELAWALEGTQVGLLLAPALTDIAGPRVQVKPVNGLPLLQLAEPQFSGASRFFKAALDKALALVLMLLLSPLFLALALAVRVSSPGPVVFRQRRIGLNGKEFTILKFRTMTTDAEARRAELQDANDHGEDHVLFKMAADPRITRVGRLLRRYSLDELPQFLNVVSGSMSLVGPRPQLPDEVARYEGAMHRRLKVKPGITGLWQVSGRADLDWEETVRLDLYYVENWSPVLDLEIVWKTLFAVVKGAGAR